MRFYIGKNIHIFNLCNNSHATRHGHTLILGPLPVIVTALTLMYVTSTAGRMKSQHFRY